MKEQRRKEQINGKGAEKPENFPKNDGVHKVIRSGTNTRRIWRIIEGTYAVKIKVRQTDGKIKAKFFRESPTIKSEMGTGAIGQAIGLLTPAMFNADSNPNWLIMTLLLARSEVIIYFLESCPFIALISLSLSNYFFIILLSVNPWILVALMRSKAAMRS